MRLAAVGLGLLLVIGPAMADESGAAFAPASSVAVQSDAAGVIVSWKPGEEVADTYRVYGLTDAGRVRLAEWTTSSTKEASVTVPNGYAKYGVVGVKGGQESPLVVSTLLDVDDPPCVSIVLTIPPGYYIWCLEGVGSPRLKLMFSGQSSLIA